MIEVPKSSSLQRAKIIINNALSITCRFASVDSDHMLIRDLDAISFTDTINEEYVSIYSVGKKGNNPTSYTVAFTLGVLNGQTISNLTIDEAALKVIEYGLDISGILN